MSQNLPERSLWDFLSLRHPNHFVLPGANNRNVIITHRFLAAPVQGNRDFFLPYWLYFSTVSSFLNIRASYYSASSGFRPEGEIPAEAIIQETKKIQQLTQYDKRSTKTSFDNRYHRVGKPCKKETSVVSFTQKQNIICSQTLHWRKISEWSIQDHVT